MEVFLLRPLFFLLVREKRRAIPIIIAPGRNL
jgi:hypothetical protein